MAKEKLASIGVKFWIYKTKKTGGACSAFGIWGYSRETISKAKSGDVLLLIRVPAQIVNVCSLGEL